MTFDQVGGLDGYIDKLKEMIFLPLVYPELFERFHVSPPRGVLLYGPPGESDCMLDKGSKPQQLLLYRIFCIIALFVGWLPGGCRP